MKRCPTCQRTYSDEALNFCREDGAPLMQDYSSPLAAQAPSNNLDQNRSDAVSTILLRSDDLLGGALASSALAPPSRRRSSRKVIDSLAVLPLVNAGDDPETEYLSDGITESLINKLARMPKLRVMARSTVFHYKGREIDPRLVGQDLGVRAVLTGRVIHQGDRLFIAAELVNTMDGAHIWGEQYNRPFSDIFEMQEEIAREITDKLRLKLTRNEKKTLSKRNTKNPAAYQLYLKGRYHWNKRTGEGLREGLKFFQQAIELDPDYASAYAGMSDSYTLLVVREELSPEEGFAKAKAAAEMALKIDDALGKAHASMAHVLLHQWEWEGAEREFNRSFELNSSYPSGHHWYSEYLIATGRLDEAVSEAKQAHELDPLSRIINVNIADVLYYARRYDESIKQSRKTIEMDNTFWIAHIVLAKAFLEKGFYDEAIAELHKAAKLSEGSTEVMSLHGYAYAVSGNRERAQEVLDGLSKQSERRPVSPFHFARIFAGLNEPDMAFHHLDQAFERLAVPLYTFKVDPRFDNLRSDPRRIDLLRRMNLPA